MWFARYAAILIFLFVLAAPVRGEKPVIAACKARDQRAPGDVVSYTVTVARAGDFKVISTWLKGPGDVESPKMETTSTRDTLNYTIKFTVPKDHLEGPAQLLTKIDNELARTCDLVIRSLDSRGSRVKPNPFATGIVLTGTVKDSIGVVLPGVTIRAKNKATGAFFDAIANDAGKYQLNVEPGNYEVSAELPGFSKMQQDVTANPGATKVVDFNFKLKTKN